MPHSLKSKVKSLCYKGEITEKERDRIIKALEQEPSEDAISRDAVEKITWEEPNYDDVLNVLTEVRDKVRALPSVTPPKPCEEENPNCTECRYYDKEKHYCPRFCKVIENTMAEITSEQTRPQGKWIDIGIAMEGRKYKNHECDIADAYYCDYCGYNQYIKTNYCPWCGAEMVGEE